jgi:hypothetical protein
MQRGFVCCNGVLGRIVAILIIIFPNSRHSADYDDHKKADHLEDRLDELLVSSNPDQGGGAGVRP